ncbi:hypothetical protein [uncultured Selenomonas sp.]|uniref:hypothetical protein n=1 Tax=uncultured Selenomonas sp. TaxID=159275 RepID=UPI0028F14D37|nr:hypothetical protein [uncultured Selenomonas sp.]
MKRLLLLLCMLAYMPTAFASTWQEDVEAVTSHPEKVYEVYCGMPYEDFEQTWENVPNWSCKDKKPRQQIFEKIMEGTPPLRETFTVLGDRTSVIHMEVSFLTDDKKLMDWIFNYTRNRLAIKFGNPGEVEGCQVIDMNYPTFITWPGHPVMLTRGSVERGGKTYRVTIML